MAAIGPVEDCSFCELNWMPNPWCKTANKMAANPQIQKVTSLMDIKNLFVVLIFLFLFSATRRKGIVEGEDFRCRRSGIS